MAATRLITLHVNKGKTVAQCLNERLDYSHLPEGLDAELLGKVLANPEMVALLSSLAKSLK